MATAISTDMTEVYASIGRLAELVRLARRCVDPFEDEPEYSQAEALGELRTFFAELAA